MWMSAIVFCQMRSISYSILLLSDDRLPLSETPGSGQLGKSLSRFGTEITGSGISTMSSPNSCYFNRHVVVASHLRRDFINGPCRMRDGVCPLLIGAGE